MSQQPPPPPPSPGPGSADDASRAQAVKRARKRVAAQVNFKRNMVVWAFLALLCVVIWLLSGRGYFWPGWVIFGLAVSAFWMWLAAYGPREREPSQEEIDAELRRDQGGQNP